MRQRLLALAESRARLVARAREERAAIAALLAPADGAAFLSVSLFRAALRALEEARHHPLLAVFGVTLLAALRPRRAIGWLARGWSLWRLYRGAYGWWQRFAAAAPAGAPK
ncbi:MAG TPA: YqjK family protein [Burkholderiales bacterium]|jgi:hypothetical protein